MYRVDLREKLNRTNIVLTDRRTDSSLSIYGIKFQGVSCLQSEI